MKRLLPSLILAATIAVSASAHADTNLVTNGSFEDTPSGAYSVSSGTAKAYDYVKGAGSPPYTTDVNTTLVTGWTATAIPQGGSYGLVNKNIFSPSLATAGDGQALFIQDYFDDTVVGGILISDPLGTIAANSTYTLSLDIGAPPSFDGLSSSTSGELAPKVYFALLGNGTAITSQTLLNTAVTQDGLTNYTLSFTTGAAGGYVGQTLTLQLQAIKAFYTSPPFAKSDPGGEVAVFDDVVVTVPEPSTYALVGAGCGLLFLAMRRRSLKRS